MFVIIKGTTQTSIYNDISIEFIIFNYLKFIKIWVIVNINQIEDLDQMIDIVIEDLDHEMRDLEDQKDQHRDIRKKIMMNIQDINQGLNKFKVRNKYKKNAYLSDSRR